MDSWLPRSGAPSKHSFLLSVPLASFVKYATKCIQNNPLTRVTTTAEFFAIKKIQLKPLIVH